MFQTLLKILPSFLAFATFKKGKEFIRVGFSNPIKSNIIILVGITIEVSNIIDNRIVIDPGMLM